MNAAIPTTTAEPPVSTVHPELHHYTTLPGLEGIWLSGHLRASRHDNMNDAGELLQLRPLLVPIVRTHVLNVLRAEVERNPAIIQQITGRGGFQALAAREAEAFVDLLYRATFGGQGEPGFATPFLACFCTHSGDNEYERQNGLLSQWRGYAGDGGVAIVFDASGLEQLLQREYESAAFAHLGFADVIYADDALRFEQRFSELIAKADDGFLAALKGEDPGGKAIGALFTPLVAAAPRLKHRGYHEEREVRVIACPTSPSTLEAFRTDPHYREDKPLKPVRQDKRPDGSKRHYIELFTGIPDGVRPHIKRIIVGPGPSQDEAARRAAELTAGRVPITKSATPYRS
ncbi:MAG TPA: DUF2971 domain-containing protein [Azospirillaceae bacterium]|nr:DUF2971 domain-containing protein [Azospirillaceae bacterium]